MNISYTPIKSQVFSIDKNKHMLSILDDFLEPSLEGDVCLYESDECTVGISYTFSVKDIELAENYLEIPILTKQYNIIKDVNVKYFLTDDFSNLDIDSVTNACSIFKQSLFPEHVCYVSIDINKIISDYKNSEHSFITFVCTCSNNKKHNIKVYSAKQNLSNIIIKSKQNSCVSDNVEKYYNAIVDKYYDEWLSDINNSELCVKETPPYTLNLNDSIELTERFRNDWKTYKLETSTYDVDNNVEYNKYGSIIEEETRQPATGYFYVTFVNDKQCVVDPDGYINIIKNIAFPIPQISGDYMSLPKNHPDIVENYNTEEWKTQTYRNITECGLNTYEQYMSEVNNSIFKYPLLNCIAKIPVLDAIVTSKVIPFKDPICRSLFNIFVEDGENNLRTHLKNNVFINDTFKDNRIVAYLLDNEPRFEKQDLALCLMTTDPKSIFRRNAAKCWVKKHYNVDDCSLADITQEMGDNFISFEFYVYSKIVTETIREFDTNHMIFSPAIQCNKFSGSPYLPFSGFLKNNENFFKVLNKFYDALAVTNYSDYDVLAEEFDNLKLNIPVFLNEFSMKSIGQDVFINKFAGPAVKTQQERAKYFEHIALQCIKHKKCIGYTWFQYSDRDCPDEGIVNRGIVNSDNELYPEISYSMKKINSNAETIRNSN